MVRKRLILILIISFVVVGCVQPVNYEDAGKTYMDQWLAGLRQMVIEECAQEPDPAQCRTNLRTVINSIIPPEMQHEGLRQGK